MTHFHCRRCRKRVIVAYHAERAYCSACGEPMRRGAGRRTRPDARGAARTDPPAPRWHLEAGRT